MSTEFKQVTLSQCAKFDYENKIKDIVTGWGRISKDRTNKGISRKDKIRKGK